MMEDPLNLEFIRLLAKSRWNQAEAARQLSLTPATVSRYVSGETRPSITVLDLFRMKIGDTIQPSDTDVPERKQTVLSQTELELLEEIRGMDVVSKEQFIRHVKAIAGLVPKTQDTSSHKQGTKSRGIPEPSSLSEDEIQEGLETAVQAGEAEIESERKHVTDVPTESKASPSRGASKRTNSQRSFPGGAPGGRGLGS